MSEQNTLITHKSIAKKFSIAKKNKFLERK